MLFFLLFIPETQALQTANTIVEEIAHDPTYQTYEVKYQGDIPVFLPHVTLMGLEGSNLENVKTTLQKTLAHQSSIKLTVDDIRTTSQYFRSVFVFFDQNQDMTQLITRLRHQFKNVPDLTIKSSNEDYTHMSLVYTSATLEHKKKIAEGQYTRHNIKN